MSPTQQKSGKNITVIIPAYNAALSLPSCLESVLNQSYQPLEVLVVDDCSTDLTKSLLKKYPVKALSLPRRMGAAYARVAGARAARGEIVAFLDADCVAGPDWLHTLSEALEKDAAGVGGGYRFDDRSNLFETFIARLARDWFSAKQPEGQAILIGGNSAFRKDAFLDREYFWELTHRSHFASGDDTLLCLELLKTNRLHYLPGSPVTHTPYGVMGFFRRQIRWARSRTLLFLKQPVKQKASLAPGPMLKLLFQIASSGLVAAAGVFILVLPLSLIGSLLCLLSFLLFLFAHLSLLNVLTETQRFSFAWIAAAFFLWIRSLAYIAGILSALLSELRNAASGVLDKLIFAYNFIHPRRLFKIYVFVTNRCNRRCEFCFYRNKLARQSDRDLSLPDDYKKISSNLPAIPYLTITGGEPFLRNDLDQIALLFYRKNRTRFIVIPTNGTLPSITEEILERLLIDAPRLNLTVQVSLNGLEKFFLDNTDCPDSELILDTWHRLGRLQKRFKRVRRHLSLVITSDNSAMIKDLARQIPLRLGPDHFFITPQRSGPNKVELPHISLQEFISVLQNDAPSEQVNLFNWIFKIVYERVRREFIKVYQLRKMSSPCLSGKKFIVIDPAGQIQFCELIDDKVGSILNNNWTSLQKTSDYQKTINKIYLKECVCTWGCAIVSNTIHRFPFWFKA
ncbi:MAG: glycosyltransferase [Thermodesulfobacteriota bacterium]